VKRFQKKHAEDIAAENFDNYLFYEIFFLNLQQNPPKLSESYSYSKFSAAKHRI
jgi:hypothetical protein